MRNYIYSPIVISGPSGAGKSELIDYIEKTHSSFIEANGVTTRARRVNEVGKMDFLTRGEFEKLISSNELIEYCNYNGNYYGVLKSEFQKLDTHNLIFNVGYSSAKEIKLIYDDTLMIYLLPPNKEELMRRLGDRGNNRYIIGVKETLQNALNYEYLLISLTNDLKATCDDFMDIVEQGSNSTQKKLIRAKNRDFVKNFYK